MTLESLWYSRHPLRWLLWPFSLIFQGISSIRRFVLCHFFQYHSPVPLIVVGNLSVGGAGKTPLVMALIKNLQHKGLRVGIVSRGYGAQITRFPHEVDIHQDHAAEVGDEPLLLALNCHCPVVIAPNRSQAVQYLLKTHALDVIISDDGLQHYAMGRAIEIVVIDGERGLGNGLCLPAGPLRENARRLKKADFIVVNSGFWPNAYTMKLVPEFFRRVNDNAIAAPELSEPVAAIAGIGNPQRFFNSLKEAGIRFRPYVFPDHHPYTLNDLILSEKTLLMTEKDAVKCRHFANDTWYFLPVEAQLSDAFWQAFWSHDELKGCV